MATHDASWPTTVEEAANRILQSLSADDRRRVSETTRENLATYHHGWGRGIRNAFGLWKGNTDLLASSGCADPDACSMRIIERVWETLQAAREPAAE